METAMPEPVRTQTLNHIALKTQRLDESIAFYTTVLGAKLITRPPFDFPGAWLYLAGIQIHLIQDLPIDGRADINTRDNHFAISVESVDEVERLVQAHGIPYRRQMQPIRNVPQLFIQDPDGHQIEFGTYWKIDE